MSQYKGYLSNGRILLYGWDNPSGGYFITEFYTPQELEHMDCDCSEVAFSSDFITLKNLENLLKKYGISYNIESLVWDCYIGGNPTELQLKIAKMFGHDPIEKRNMCIQDIEKNYSNFLEK